MVTDHVHCNNCGEMIDVDSKEFVRWCAQRPLTSMFLNIPKHHCDQCADELSFLHMPQINQRILEQIES